MDSELPTGDDPKEIRREISEYPTDLRLRFRLGVALLERGEYGAAVPELQRAMYRPRFRLQAMRLLVKAFDAKGMSDLAGRMREQLSRESGDEGDSGSAPVPTPTRPVKPPDSSSARKIRDENDSAD
jgi:hypothetical protein